MQTKSDTSYGIIPLHKKGDTYEVFLINQIGRRGDIFWTFPKGHSEENETPKETALRELKEETGMCPETILEREPFVQSYEFIHDGMLIQKKTHYFLALVTDTAYVLEKDEVSDAGWFSLEDAQSILTHEQARELIVEVYDFLKKLS
jgi:8-oxo-dGTP pyrophosphatase MutT (NUDIX family)